MKMRMENGHKRNIEVVDKLPTVGEVNGIFGGGFEVVTEIEPITDQYVEGSDKYRYDFFRISVQWWYDEDKDDLDEEYRFIAISNGIE